MPPNKNPGIRYFALDKCFRNPGRRYSIDDLVDACNEALLDVNPYSSGIQKRQIYMDIKFMQDSRSYNAPIISYKEGRRVYYRYSDTDFSISNQPINEMEAQQLTETIQTLSRFKGMPQFDWIEDIKIRLQQTFHLNDEVNIISFDENPYLSGKEHVGTLYQAIVNKTVLLIAYKPYKTNIETTFEIHPYHLKEYNNRWFLFGLNNNEYKSITNIALDRIQNIKESRNTYIENTTIDFNDFFEDVIGVSVNIGEQPQKVVIKADPSIFPYIKSKPLHGSQKTRMNNTGETYIELEVQLNYELVSKLLSHGEKVEVIEPLELREKLAKRISESFENYKTCV